MTFEEFDLLPPSVQEYLRIYLDVTKGKSKLTVLEYASDLRTFFRFLVAKQADISPDELNKDYDMSYIDIDWIKKITTYDIFKFLDYCSSKLKNNNATRARKISSLKGYFAYISTKMKYIEVNPMDPVEAPKAKKSLPKYLTLEQSIALLNSVEGENKERDYCILTIFLNCGLRVAEMVSLNISDINFDEETMIVTGKGNKQRKIYLNKACMDAINEYLKVRPRDKVKDRDALFISRLNKRMGRQAVQNMVYHYLEKIGLDSGGYSVHKLRHTAATLMYQHGNVDVLVLEEMLGHENLSTTEIYTHLLDKQLKDAAKQNPLSGENKKKS
ncbi:MAG: tyrosine recombinase XerC [Acutalibacteraceae bacterium]